MEYLDVILLMLCILFFICLCLFVDVIMRIVSLSKRKQREVQKETQSQVVQEYDSAGYNRQGYNNVGRNRQGKYNRFYNVKCYQSEMYSEEGFLDIRRNPMYLTTHARQRMRERMAINEGYKMDILAFEAYQFGKVNYSL